MHKLDLALLRSAAEWVEDTNNAGVNTASLTPRTFITLLDEIGALIARAEAAEASVAQAAELARREEREKGGALINAYLMSRKPGAERMVLAIAANIVRRGRELTSVEKLENLQKAMDEHDEEMRARAAQERTA